MQYNFAAPDEVMTKLINEYPDLTGREIKNKFNELQEIYFKNETTKNHEILNKFNEVEGKTLYFACAEDSSEMEIYKVNNFLLKSLNNGTTITCDYKRYYIERDESGEFSIHSNVLEYTDSRWFLESNSSQFIPTTEDVWKKIEKIFEDSWANISNLFLFEILKNG